jgi:phosphotransferase system IIA component
MEVLIHIGVNTVNMQGEGFTAFVEEGAEVKAGQKLLGFDRDAIARAGYNDTVVMLLTNSDDLEGVECGIK